MTAAQFLEHEEQVQVFMLEQKISPEDEHGHRLALIPPKAEPPDVDLEDETPWDVWEVDHDGGAFSKESLDACLNAGVHLLYKKGWDPAESIRKMAEWKGHFDPQVFQAFVKSVGIYPVGALVRLESGRTRARPLRGKDGDLGVELRDHRRHHAHGRSCQPSSGSHGCSRLLRGQAQ